RPDNQPEEDRGGGARRHADRNRVHGDRHGVPVPGHTGRRSRAARSRGRVPGNHGRLIRITVEASRGDERQLAPDSRTRRCARSHRRAVVRDPRLLLHGAPGARRVKQIAILGSTGSIGRSALAVVDAHPDRLRVAALAAGDNAALLAEQVARYCPEIVGMATAEGAARLRRACGSNPPTIVSGPEGLVAVATHSIVDVVICASAGTAGLEAVLAAIESGKTVALANKEVLVMAGQLVTEAARRRGVLILPVDSEHNAIHQCLHGRDRTEI